MASYDVFDAFNDCIDRLNAGQSLDDCLRAHPQHADRLRPLLETAILVQRARPAVLPGAKMRVREQVMQAAPRRSLRLNFTPPGLALVAASVLVVGFVLLLLANRGTGPSLRTEPLPTGTHTATATLTPPPTVTATPSATASPTAIHTVTATPTPAATFSPSPTTTPSLTPPQAAAGTLTITSASVNLRIGPATGYDIVSYGYAGETLTVTARHTSELWLQVKLDERDAWVASSLGTLAGDCTTLSVSTLPLHAAPDSGGDDGSDEVDDGDDGDDSDDDDYDDDSDDDDDDDDD